MGYCPLARGPPRGRAGQRAAPIAAARESAREMPPEIDKPLKKFLPNLVDARTANLNEADTVQRIIRVFETVLGYDLLQDVSREAQMKNKFVDIAIKVDGAVQLLVEAKSAATVLRDRHIEQAQAYASRNNYRWVVLTNSIDWRLFHLTFEEGIEYELAFAVDLSDAEAFDDAACKLALLHKQSIRKGELEKFWRTAKALGPASIARGLFHEDALNVIRRLVRKHEGFLVDQEDLAKSIHDMLTTEAREQIGPLRIGKARRAPVRRTSLSEPVAQEAPPCADSEPSPNGSAADDEDDVLPEDARQDAEPAG